MAEQSLHDYSSTYEWRARAEDYDAWCDRKKQQGVAIEAKQQGRKRERRRLKLADKIAKVLETKLNGMIKDGLNADVNASQLARLFREYVVTTRLEEGKATERVETTQDLSKLSDEELEQLDKLTRKIKGEG